MVGRSSIGPAAADVRPIYMHWKSTQRSTGCPDVIDPPHLYRRTTLTLRTAQLNDSMQQELSALRTIEASVLANFIPNHSFMWIK